MITKERHLHNIWTSADKPRFRNRFITNVPTFQVSPLVIQHDILPVEQLVADLTGKFLVPVLLFVFWEVAVCRKESETHLTLKCLVICKEKGGKINILNVTLHSVLILKTLLTNAREIGWCLLKAVSSSLCVCYADMAAPRKAGMLNRCRTPCSTLIFVVLAFM